MLAPSFFLLARGTKIHYRLRRHEGANLTQIFVSMSSSITIQKRPLPTADDEASQWTQRRFFKKTARGKVQKILRERYLRDDVSCGRSGCEVCEGRMSMGRSDKLEGGAGLQELGTKVGKEGIGSHFIVLDTNVVLHQVSRTICFLVLPHSSRANKGARFFRWTCLSHR
jgi:hypothetical protein